MGDAKWVKFEVNMFDDTKLKIIDTMDERDSIHYIWARLLVLAGKINCGGHFYMTDNIPYTIKTLAIEFNRKIEDVKTAIKVLKRLEMVEFTVDKVFKIRNWDKHQNVEGLERLRNENNRRVAKHRAKKKETKVINEEDANNDVPQIDESNKPIINNNEEINYKEADDKVNPVEEDKENTSIINEEVICIKDNSVDETINKEIKTKEYNDCTDINNAFKPINEKGNNSDSGNDTGNMDDNIENNSNGNCNVTCNDDSSNCNVTVMEQKKKEKKKKMEKKRENESDFNREDEEENNLIEFSDSPHSLENNENINNQAIASLLNHYENMTGIYGGLNLGSVKLAISMHGYECVKMALNKAIEVNKPNMTYINGILKNWRREGYPNQREEIKNESGATNKSNTADKNEFTGFKPKKSRKLTEAERKGAEEKLI